MAHITGAYPTKCETGLKVWSKLTLARLISGIPPVAKPAKTVSACFLFHYQRNRRLTKELVQECDRKNVDGVVLCDFTTGDRRGGEAAEFHIGACRQDKGGYEAGQN